MMTTIMYFMTDEYIAAVKWWYKQCDVISDEVSILSGVFLAAPTAFFFFPIHMLM